MRITGGINKGRKMKTRAIGKSSPFGTLRATSAKVREAIFNILGGDIKDALFLDLYAGTGAVGTEAMSRQARKVYFIESDRRRVEGIEELLSGCGCRQRAVVVYSKAEDFIKNYSREEKFDIVFVDPPYAMEEIVDIVGCLGCSDCLAEGALVIAEHSSRRIMPDETGMLKKKKAYRYGDTALTLYVRSK